MSLGLIGYNLYLLLLGLFSLPVIILRSIKKGKFWVKLPNSTRKQFSKTIWIVAESAGEAILAKTIINAFHTRKSDTSWLIMTTTNSGYRMAERILGDFDLAYLPVDYPFFIKILFKRYNPACILMVENFFWPNLLRRAASHQVNTIVVNARISRRVLRRNRYFKHLFKSLAQRVDRFYLQNEIFRADYLRLGVDKKRLSVIGDVKFDQQLPIPTTERTKDIIGKFNIASNERLIVAGSTHHGEETIILDAFEEILKVSPGTILLLAPRHIERVEEVGGLLTSRGFHFQLFSKLQHSGEEVILLDTMGDLSTLYGIAYVSIVGGSFVDGVGGHNILEPAAQGSPVFYGPNIEGFRAPHAVLSEAGVGMIVLNAGELVEGCLRFLQEPKLRREIGERAKRLIAEHKGVSAKIADSVLQGLSRSNNSEGFL